jgi:hypothetical protein
MSLKMAVDKTIEPKWHGTALLAVFAILFTWLRRSEVWQNRWAGFVLGLLFLAALFFYLCEQESAVTQALLPKRIGLLIATVFILLSAGTMIRFFLGGTGDDAVASFVLFAFGVGGIHVHHRLPDSANTGSGQGK